MDRVNEATKDCFDTIIRLRQAEAADIPPPEVLNHRLRGSIDEVLRRAAVLGFSHQDAQDMSYALVALMDEVVLNKPEQYRQFWMSNLLQLHYFNETGAGDNFFNRINAVRKDPHRAEVLRVYYLCLLFGFQGRYRIRGGELELMSLIDTVQKELERAQPFDFDVLAPHGERPVEKLELAKRQLSMTSAVFAAMAAALVFYGGLYLSLKFTATTVLSDINLHATQVKSASLSKAPPGNAKTVSGSSAHTDNAQTENR